MADTGNAILMLTSGDLTISPLLIDFGTVTLNGATQIAAGATSSWQAVDATGSGNGWHVDVSASDFLDGTGHSISVAGFKISLSDAAITYVDGNAQPISQVTTLTPLSPTPLKLALAASGQGMGTYTLLPGFTLDVPPSTYAGSYISIVTVTATAAP